MDGVFEAAPVILAVPLTDTIRVLEEVGLRDLVVGFDFVAATERDAEGIVLDVPLTDTIRVLEEVRVTLGV